MDIRTSSLEEICENVSDIISGYFLGKFSDVSMGVKPSRSKV